MGIDMTPKGAKKIFFKLCSNGEVISVDGKTFVTQVGETIAFVPVDDYTKKKY